MVQLRVLQSERKMKRREKGGERERERESKKEREWQTDTLSSHYTLK